MKSVIIYISNWNTIGGVETFVENFCKRMNKHFDITLLYDKIDSIELPIDLSSHCKIENIDKTKTYESDYFINSTAWGFSPYDNIKASKVVQIVHADYTHVIANWNFKYVRHKSVTHHVAVGQLVEQAFNKVCAPNKIDKIIYNLLDNTIKLGKKPRNKVLNLITVSRLSGEKGFDRMLKLAKLLTESKIDYLWTVYGNHNNPHCNKIVNQFKPHPNVVFKGIIKNPIPEIHKADYLVQLSDTEGFAYSVYEALQCKTPCIITPFASGNEQIQHGVNGYIVPFDMDGINLTEITTKIPVVKEFKEIGSEKSWIDFLEKAELKSKPEKLKGIASVKASKKYFDTELKRNVMVNEVLEVNLNRLKQLADGNVCELISIK